MIRKAIKKLTKEEARAFIAEKRHQKGQSKI